jgi:nitroreductase
LDFYEVVKRRRSVREFQSRPVEEEKLLRVLEAGLKAPSHNHLREWEFILIKDFEQRKRAVDLGVLKTQQDWHYIKLHRIARACRINNRAFVRYLYCQICFIYLTDAQDKMQ